MITNASVISDEFHVIDVRISWNSSWLGEDSLRIELTREFRTVNICSLSIPQIAAAGMFLRVEIAEMANPIMFSTVEYNFNKYIHEKYMM